MLHLDFAAGELKINGAPLIIANQDHKGNDDTGLAVWDGAVVLAKYIEHLEEQGQSVVKERRVLELGCGTGLCGIACAVMGAQSVVLSDLEYALRGARRNIELNGSRLCDLAADVSARELDWCGGLPPWAADVDVVVAADVVWRQDIVQPLVTVLRALLLQLRGRSVRQGSGCVGRDGAGDEGDCDNERNGTSATGGRPRMARALGALQAVAGAEAELYSDSSSDTDAGTHEGASAGSCASGALDAAAVASDLGLESWTDVAEGADTPALSPAAGSAPAVLLAYTFRFTDVHRAFFSALSESGISWREIPRHEVHRSRFVPEQTDDTDPVVRIFTLHLEREVHGCGAGGAGGAGSDTDTDTCT